MKRMIIGIVIGLLIGTAGTAFAATSEPVQAIFAKFNFVVNGEEKTLEADPLVYQGGTYLPVRVVANMLGYDVTYKADSRTIELDSIVVATNQKTTQGAEKQMSYPVVTEEWISLRQLAERGIDVKVGPEHNVLTIQNGDQSIRFLTTDIAEGETAEVALYEADGTVIVKSDEGRTYLRVDQLQSYGIMN